MLKMLRYDFYKIFKSKMLLSLLILSFALCLINPIIFHLVHSSIYSVLDNLTNIGLLCPLFWIFLVPFAAKDYSSRYIINLNVKNNKIYYILSKVFYIFIFCLSMIMLSFIFELIFNYAFDPNPSIYNKSEDRFTIKQFVMFQLAQLTTGTALGAFALFLTTLFKKEYIPLIIIVLYVMFLSNIIYEAINTAVGEPSFIERFTIFGLSSTLATDPLKQIMYHVYVPIGYTVVFVALSYLLLKLRRV